MGVHFLFHWSKSCCRVALSKTRCEYIRVRSAPPSMAPQGFGECYPTSAPKRLSGLFRTKISLMP
ncbi:hypothetical protein J122_2167 [Marinobacter excellens LAMA 842]|uniref:Uncharacterized protein n=1 Tax=Marinobacter excellens LAMA 842 TaxID=1306954 RepID=A0A137SAY8_9GAMM|nr:hypothetical protein J122_2167 [Marinobacter excellens LAMA 842]